MALQLENQVARFPSTQPTGLAPDELEAYLSLGYKEFDATPGSGHCRFRDQPRHLAQAGELIEAYLERHPTNEQRLDAAAKRFVESSREHNGKTQAPFGLATRFQLAR